MYFWNRFTTPLHPLSESESVHIRFHPLSSSLIFHRLIWDEERNSTPTIGAIKSQPSEPSDRVGSTRSSMTEPIENPWNHRIVLEALSTETFFAAIVGSVKGFSMPTSIYFVFLSSCLIFLFIAFLNKICLALFDGSGGHNICWSQCGGFEWRCWLHSGNGSRFGI